MQDLEPGALRGRDSLSGSRRDFLIAAVSLTAASLLSRAQPSVAQELEAAPGGASEWRSVLRTMFPHPDLSVDLYEPAAEALVAAAGRDDVVRVLLAAGRRTLAEAAGGSWADATEGQRTIAIESIFGSALFSLLRQTTVFTFYNDPRVWEQFGYEGDAWRIGGWLTRGVDSIDWLPDVPAVAEEHDGD